MATKTLGTNGTTTLTALQWFPGQTVADIATIAAAILDDGAVQSAGGGFLVGATAGQAPNPLLTPPRHQAAASAGPFPGAFMQNGQLIIPNRGVLRLIPGDWVGVDANGWPVLVSGLAIAGSGTFTNYPAATSWTHS
jgi:hypothetical protein